MPDPEVVRFLRARKAAVLSGEREVMRDLSKRWLEMERVLRAEMEALALELERLPVVSEAAILRHERFSRLLYQARAEVGKFNEFADETLRTGQATMAKQGIEDALQAVRLSFEGAGSIAPQFNRLPVKALEAMFGYAGDGSSLRGLLSKAYPEAVNGMMDALMKGLAFGNHPTDVGRKMAQEFGIGLNRALTIARTEMLRAYRTGNFEQYRESGVVSGYRRLAAHDSRVCIGCLFRDGELIDSLDGEFDEHPNGRCTAVPVVIGVPPVTWQSGAEWFAEQPVSTQRQMLGDQRYEMWQAGTGLQEFSKRVKDPTWGGSYVPTPVKDL